MNHGTQIERNFLQTIIEEYELAVAELQASNREIALLLDRIGIGNGDGNEPLEAPPSEPRRLPDHVSLGQLQSVAAQTQERCREAIREAMILRSRSREVRQAGSHGQPTSDGKGLSRREREVLSLMVDGKSSKEIAATLGISFKTAVTHRASIMGKLNVHELASVVREAIRRGLV